MLDWISSQGESSDEVKGGDVGDNVVIASQL
jgi:hypothetical protein